MKKISRNWLIYLIGIPAIFSCSDDDVPPVENQEEEITRVTAVFTNTADAGDKFTAVWFDADGEGSGAPVIDDISLKTNTTYTLSLTLENTLVDPPEDISVEVEEEADEHMFFFGFTDGIFSDPEGTGNISARSGAVNYNDIDSNGYPLGLETTWTTGAVSGGTFRIILKHQPDIKSDVSGSTDGETDMDITFNLLIE